MHRPLTRYRIISSLSCLLLVAAFVLFLLVAISVPIVKPVYLFTLQSTVQNDVATSVAQKVKFGAWGLCASRYVARLLFHAEGYVPYSAS